MYDTILIPTDDSEAAVDAARHGIVIAERFDARIHTLYVVDDRYEWMEASTIPALIEAMEEEGTNATDAIVALGGEHDMTVTADVRHGPPPQVIADYAGEHDIDLIVMGSHGKTRLERTLIGSVTEKTVRLAETPVLIVK